MAILQMFPEHIRPLILDSPLPGFANIDEQELANFNRVLTSLLGSNDSTLLDRFHAYFSNLAGKVFTIDYQLKSVKTEILNYDRSEGFSTTRRKTTTG